MFDGTIHDVDDYIARYTSCVPSTGISSVEFPDCCVGILDVSLFLYLLLCCLVFAFETDVSFYYCYVVSLNGSHC